MPNIDDFDAILKEAVIMTDSQFASRISSLTRLNDAEINRICPAKADKEALAKLMSIVKGAGDENSKRAELINNIQTFAGVIVKVLSIVV